MDRLEMFVEASTRLTGFSRVELFGTGAAKEYLETLEAVLETPVLDTLFAAIGDLVTDHATEAEIAGSILSDPVLAPIVKNVIVLWYCGTWQQLPDTWRASHGCSPKDTTRVVSANSYLSGLQWKLVGAHPPGGDMQGFASWSRPPRGEER